MYDLQICIPSSGRSDAQKTLLGLPQNSWPNIIIVVPLEEVDAYQKSVPSEVRVIPFEGKGISAKRQFILDLQSTGKLVMMDDDLKFWKRLKSGRFVAADNIETEHMLHDISGYLTTYPYVGLVDKFFSDTRPRGHVFCNRFNQVMAINRDLLPSPWPKFRPMVHEEHDFHLQFITRGMKTAVITEWTKNDKYNASGGCSAWRTDDVMMAASKMMLELWPGIVSINENKEPKGAHLQYNWRNARIRGGL